MQRRPEAFDSQLRTDADGHVVNVGADPRDRYKRIFGDTSVTCGDDLSEVLEQALGERLSSAEADKTFEILAWHPGSGSPSDRRQRTISGCLDNQVDRLVFVSDDAPADSRGVPVEQIASFEIHNRRVRGDVDWLFTGWAPMSAVFCHTEMPQAERSSIYLDAIVRI